MSFKKVLISIPAYNEEKNIRLTIEKIKNAMRGKIWDILVVDDGSKDGTVSLVKKMGVRVVSHPYNMGYGVAIQTGYKYALENEYEVLVQIDADGQHDPKYIKKMLETLEKQKADVVIGSRFMEKTGYKAPMMRKIGMVLFGFIVSKVTGKKVSDSTSGYQVVKGTVLPFLVSDFFPCDYPDADLLIMLHFAGFKTIEIPMKMFNNTTGKSMHSSIRKNIYYVMKMCLSIFTIILRKVTGLQNK